MLRGVFMYSSKKDQFAENYMHGDCENGFVKMNLNCDGYKGLRYNITLKCNCRQTPIYLNKF